jgi:hypothetical protein
VTHEADVIGDRAHFAQLDNGLFSTAAFSAGSAPDGGSLGAVAEFVAIALNALLNLGGILVPASLWATSARIDNSRIAVRMSLMLTGSRIGIAVAFPVVGRTDTLIMGYPDRP